MDGLETRIVDINEEALDALFDETPDKTVNAETLLGSKRQSTQQQSEEDDEEETEEEVSVPKRKEKAVPKQPRVRQDVIEDLDDDFDEFDDVDDNQDEEIEDEEEETEEDDKPKKTKRAEKLAENEDTQKGVNSVLKNTMDYLIQQGAWEDFEGREELELDNETYAKIALEQDSRRLQSMFEEMVDSTGPYGKAIIEFAKNGGNPDEVIDLFKEQKQLNSIDIEDINGQKDIIKHYYTEVMGWKSEKADKYISNLVLSNELEDEAKEVKDHFTAYYQKEVSRLNKEREDHVQRQKEAEQAFETNIRSAIKERKDLTPSERKLVEEQLLRYDQKLPNGNLVNKFYVNFAKMQANPADYIELVMFVNDKQKYTERVAIREKNKATTSAYNFIKGNGATSAKKGSSYEQIRKNDKVTGFDFGLPRK
jgi:hypothetical protein